MLKRLLNMAVDWILYSNLFIAFCAVSMVWLTRGAFALDLDLGNPYEWGLFLGTISLYAFHRYVGITKVSDQLKTGRFRIIARFRYHLLIYGLISGGLSGVIILTSYHLSFFLMLLPAIVIGLLYILPVFPSSRRLRDYALIKILLIAIAWTWLTVLMPLFEHETELTWIHMVFSADRFLFIFAITLPFDIRDLEVDRIEGVKTLPMIYGEDWSKTTAILSLLAALVCLGSLFIINSITINYFLAAGMTYSIAGFLIMKSDPEKHDYYYSGVMDGVMILYFIIWFLLGAL